MLPCRFQDEGLHFLGAVPEDKLLRSVRLDEVQTALDAEFSFGSRVQLDQVCRFVGCFSVLKAPTAVKLA